MQVRKLVLGPLETNTWVVFDDIDGPAVVIDPAADADAVIAATDGRGVALVALTHGHFDHLGAVGEIVERTGAPFATHRLDAPNVTTPAGTGGLPFGFDSVAPMPTRLLEDGDTIQAGELQLHVLHTPGHTPGGVSLLADDGSRPAHLFSGDTLFAGSVGRTDLPGGDARALSRSLAQKLERLGGETVVHPGHGPDTTIDQERRANFFWPRRTRESPRA
jgi:glyoxylase-like metal-dependent hydrolase (beta-lactamase superfamily II)